MFICTLLGSIITVAVLSSIPIYTEGIMQRMLTKDLEKSQLTSGKFPGGYLINYSTYTSDSSTSNLKTINNDISRIIEKGVSLPLVTKTNFLNTNLLKIIMDDTKKQINTNLCSLSDIQDHINILYGRMYSDKITNGIYEVILSEEAIKVLGLTLGNTYSLVKSSFMPTKESENICKIKIVGIFTYKTLNDSYWFNSIGTYKNHAFMDPNLLMEASIKNTNMPIKEAQWFYGYDYHKIKVNNLATLIKTFESQDQWFEDYQFSLQHGRAMDTVISQYQERVKQLNIILVVLQTPILVILAFYLFMMSKLKIDFEGNEIAVIKSRGGSSLQVFNIYLIESTVIGAIALAFGPFLGLYLCKIIGASNGFLEFIQRSALPISLSSRSYLYSLIAVFFIYVFMLIPAFIASKTSIVIYKQKNSRKSKVSFLQRFYIDIVLVAISIYGLYGYQRQQKVLLISGIKGTELTIDPLLFVISVLFIFGSGLMILRIFPYCIRLIFFAGRKIWNSVFYASLTQIARASGQYQFAMIFIILTLSIGIFSANSARTINKNMEERVLYEVGTDLAVKGHWTNNQTSALSMFGPGQQDNNTKKSEELFYNEPPFKAYTKLAGVEAVTKVFKHDNSRININSEILDNVSLLGIIPHEFGKTAWFRSDLLPHHWNEYLNLMTDAPTAVLVSKAFKDKYGAKEGDQISVSWGDEGSISGVIYAFIDYWPSLNPNRKINDTVNPYFVVANLNYIQAKNIVEPYEVWLKGKPGVTSNQILSEIISSKIELESIINTSEKIMTFRNDPILQGTNGSLTLGFIVVILISFSGFLIYWILSIKKRTLQFGIFRAIGLTKVKIIGILICEQFLVTGTSILAGTGLGNLTSKLFIPLFQIVNGAEQQVPPFKVVSDTSDYIRLSVILGLMLVICFYIISRLISKLNISQTLKLGED